MSEKIIYIPKPEWWNDALRTRLEEKREYYRRGFEDTSKASGIIFKIEE